MSQAIQVEADLTAIFKGKVISQGTTVKVHSKVIEPEQFDKLSTLVKEYEGCVINIKRSGTGLTVIIKCIN